MAMNLYGDNRWEQSARQVSGPVRIVVLNRTGGLQRKSVIRDHRILCTLGLARFSALNPGLSDGPAIPSHIARNRHLLASSQ